MFSTLEKSILSAGVAMAATVMFVGPANIYAAETASATITLGSHSAGSYTYDLSLTNTGTAGSTIGTFWFSWIPGQNYLASNPTVVSAPTG